MQVATVAATSIERGWVIQTFDRLLLVVNVSMPHGEHRMLLRCTDAMGNARNVRFDPGEQVEVCAP